MGVAGKYHSYHPEEDDVIARHQHVSGIEIFVILGLLWPAQRREGPQCGGKPGVQRIRILLHVSAAALGANLGGVGSFRHHDLPAVFAVVCRDPVSPPELTGDTPVADIFQPVQVNLVKPLGHEGQFSLLDGLHGRLCQFLHGHKPLGLYHGLHGGLAAVMGSHVVHVLLDLYQKPHLIHLLHDGLPCLVAVHSGKFRAVLVDGGVVV